MMKKMFSFSFTFVLLLFTASNCFAQQFVAPSKPVKNETLKQQLKETLKGKEFTPGPATETSSFIAKVPNDQPNKIMKVIIGLGRFVRVVPHPPMSNK